MSKKKINSGWFRNGFDPRRHILTKADRLRGGRATMYQYISSQGKWWKESRSYPDSIPYGRIE